MSANISRHDWLGISITAGIAGVIAAFLWSIGVGVAMMGNILLAYWWGRQDA